MSKQKFAGDKKKGESLLGPIEKKFVNKYVDKVPKGLETYHLTLMSILWIAGILFFSYLSKMTGNLHWLWLVSLMIFLQYITDLFDGAVGRYRNTGLIKWGYYMDHFLDYLFLCSIMIGYFFIMPNFSFNVGYIDMGMFGFNYTIHFYHIMFYVFAIFGAFMVNSFLSFSATIVK